MDNAIKVLHSICQQIWKTKQCPQDWKRSILIPIPKKGTTKECDNHQTIALISHASKVMLKILQTRLQHMWTKNFQMFRKKRVTRDQIANICWIIDKAREFHKNIYSVSSARPKPLRGSLTNYGKLLREMGMPDHLTCLLRNLYAGQEATVKPCMKQLIGSRLKKEYNRAVCCHPVCLIYMLSTSWEMSGWMSYKLESR